MVEMVAIQFLSGTDQFVTGAVDGRIGIWKGLKLSKLIPGHSGVVQSIGISEGLMITCGSKDKCLNVWKTSDMKMDPSLKIELNGIGKSTDIYKGQFIVGTSNGKIILIEGKKKKVLINGHGFGEVWGLDISAKTGKIVTTSDDNKILVFDPEKNDVVNEGVINATPGPKRKVGKGASTLSSMPPNQCARAVAIHPLYENIAIGVCDGELQVRQSLEDINKTIFKAKDSKE